MEKLKSESEITPEEQEVSSEYDEEGENLKEEIEKGVKIEGFSQEEKAKGGAAVEKEIQQEYAELEEEIVDALKERMPDESEEAIQEAAKKSIWGIVGIFGMVKKFVMRKLAPAIAFAIILGGAANGCRMFDKYLTERTEKEYEKEQEAADRYFADWDELLSKSIDEMTIAEAQKVFDERRKFINRAKTSFPGTRGEKLEDEIFDKASEIESSGKFALIALPKESGPNQGRVMYGSRIIVSEKK